MKASIILSGALGIAVANACGAESKLHFNRDIRPLMSDTCFHCHGPDKNARKANLRLDIRDEALKPAKSGAVPIVPGKPDQSEIIKRLFTTDTDDLMPPEEAHKIFTKDQKETFKRWVAEGAEYEPHWAYTPLAKPVVPKIPALHSKLQNSIDAFIAEKLAEKNIAPSAEADSRTLLRRLSLDLTGLPPTPEELRSFVEATTANPRAAYEAAVERLLQSPHFGERMAVWWLDVARFTDTVGFHGDQNLRVFPYRDYVIDSFNRNKPFNEFTKEQIAGDLLPNPTSEQLIATGFNRLNMVTREGGAQPKEYLAKYGAERVRTIGGAFLGATLGCCECHDHKFDPFTARDFYSMQAFFADVRQWGVYADYEYTKNVDLKDFDNDHPFPPEIEVDSPYLKQRAESIRVQLAAIARRTSEKFQKDAKAKNDFEQWRQHSLVFLRANTTGWITPVPIVTSDVASPPKAKKASKDPEKPVAETEEKSGGTLKVEADGRIIFTSQAADNSHITMHPPAGWVSAVRLELLPDPAHKDSILRGGKKAGASLKIATSLLKKDAKTPEKLVFRQAEADLKEARYRNGSDIPGIKDVWMTSATGWNQPHVGVFLLEKPVKIEDGDTMTLEIAGNSAGCVRVSVSPFAPSGVRGDASLAQVRQAIEGPEEGMLEAYLTGTGWNDVAYK
ncbi:MAG: DUF1549 domain-containing protein, partial [Verrucomicrobiaceae bacterium]